MIFHKLKLEGAYRIDLEPREDERGFFARAWCQREFAEHGLETHIVQSNLSYNRYRGTLRGMHYQAPPHEEVKLVRCIRGSIFDVIIDLRPDSPTYLQWVGVELTATNRQMLYVPRGFAHGFQTLEDDTEVFYHVSEFYHPEAERGVRWNDPQFGIQWPAVEKRILSPKDQNWPDYVPERH
ncbi:MAG: dTDP-4-dehydrorhamnose 3,5-epimerase [Firmicutes bacterium]|nr:dTDP-4-dehydrorhamnose 3,5-epimerase [Bacillota bacterium]